MKVRYSMGKTLCKECNGPAGVEFVINTSVRFTPLCYHCARKLIERFQACLPPIKEEAACDNNT